MEDHEKFLKSVQGELNQHSQETITLFKSFLKMISVHPWADIDEFHQYFKIIQMDCPTIRDKEIVSYRLNFLKEELQELEKALLDDDLVETADALVDLVYVALGTMWILKMPFPELWNEVHATNMNKIRTPSADESKRYSPYDVNKPANWQPPKIKEILSKHGAKFKPGSGEEL